jgi:hypothetical protein
MNYGDFKKGYETAIENTIKSIISDENFAEILQKKIADIVTDYFDINTDCYTYYLTRDKSGFGVGTVTLNDFEELTTDVSVELAEYIISELSIL